MSGQNKIVFNIASGGLGRPLAGKDHYSGIIFYEDTLPSGFSTNDRIKKIYSVSQAESLGIVDTHANETKGTGGQVTITLVGGTGVVWNITVEGALLGTYTEQAGDAVGDVATGLRAAINARTSIHGWVASGSSADVDLAQPSGLGIINETGTPIAGTASATGTTTVTQVSGGEACTYDVMHYHISEFFRTNPKGILYVGIYAEGTFDAAEMALMQDYAEGNLRQIGIYLNAVAFTTGQLTLMQTQCDTLASEYKWVQSLLAAKGEALTLSSISDLTSLTNENTSYVLGEEGAWHLSDWAVSTAYLTGDKRNFQGKTYQCIKDHTSSVSIAPWDTAYWAELFENLADVNTHSISCLGACLGTVSFSKVNENIAWVNKFNLVTGYGLEVAGFVTGDLWESQTTALLDELCDKHYIFLVKQTGISGTYFNDSWTAISETNDYCTIENNRTMQKAVRGIHTNMIPNLAAPLYLNSDGTLKDDTIAVFTSDSDTALSQMEVEAEISAREVEIDSAQDVLTTSKVTITVNIVPVGVARQLEYNIGYKTKL